MNHLITCIIHRLELTWSNLSCHFVGHIIGYNHTSVLFQGGKWCLARNSFRHKTEWFPSKTTFIFFYFFFWSNIFLFLKISICLKRTDWATLKSFVLFMSLAFCTGWQDCFTKWKPEIRHFKNERLQVNIILFTATSLKL